MTDASIDGAPTGRGTATSAFGASRRESHDASEFYARFTAPVISTDDAVHGPVPELGDGRCFVGSSADMHHLPDNSVALVVTSPPYFVGKEYELAVTAEEQHPDQRVPESYLEFLHMLRSVFAECVRVLEPGGRIAVNVANLGRKPYRSLSADVITILQDDLGLLLRGEVIWQKGKTSSGSCAWGSFAKAGNPVLRDITERVIVASKGRFDRALSVRGAPAAGPAPQVDAGPTTSSSTSPATSGRSTPSRPLGSVIRRRSRSSCLAGSSTSTPTRTTSSSTLSPGRAPPSWPPCAPVGSGWATTSIPSTWRWPIGA